jgi:hypothetical protein
VAASLRETRRVARQYQQNYMRRAQYPNAVMMYIINHVNVLLTNEISTVGDRRQQTRLPQRARLRYLRLWVRPRSRRI